MAIELNTHLHPAGLPPTQQPTRPTPLTDAPRTEAPNTAPLAPTREAPPIAPSGLEITQQASQTATSLMKSEGLAQAQITQEWLGALEDTLAQAANLVQQATQDERAPLSQAAPQGVAAPQSLSEAPRTASFATPAPPSPAPTAEVAPANPALQAAQQELDAHAQHFMHSLRQAEFQDQPLLSRGAQAKVAPSDQGLVTVGLAGGLQQAASQLAASREPPAAHSNPPLSPSLHQAVYHPDEPIALLGHDQPLRGGVLELPNPPYFLSNTREAVQIFQELAGEQLGLTATPAGFELDDDLAAHLRDAVAQEIDQAEQQGRQQVQAETRYGPAVFKIQGQLETNAQGQTQLKETAEITTVVNGTELTLSGPFIKSVGPAQGDSLELPKDDSQQPWVAAQPLNLLTRLSHEQAAPQGLLQIQDPLLPAALDQARADLNTLSGQLQQSVQALQPEAALITPKNTPQDAQRQQQQEREAMQALVEETRQLLDQRMAGPASLTQEMPSAEVVLGLME